MDDINIHMRHVYIWIFRTHFIIQPSSSLGGEAKFPHNLNKWLARHIVGASPLPACYHRSSSEARSSGLANLDPKGRDISCPRFHPVQMHRVPEEECVGGSVCACVSQTCWAREEIMARRYRMRPSNCQEYSTVTVAAKIPICQREKCAYVCAHANWRERRGWLRKCKEWKDLNSCCVRWSDY